MGPLDAAGVALRVGDRGRGVRAAGEEPRLRDAGDRLRIPLDDAERAVERVLRAAPGLVVVDEAYHAFADAKAGDADDQQDGDEEE